MQKDVKIIEAPRDAMQGILPFIPTHKKAQYISALLQVGFYAIDFGSFVSSGAVPQLHDTAEVLKLLGPNHTSTKMLAIVANERGALEAIKHKAVNILGFPFAASPTFLQRNINSTHAQSIDLIRTFLSLCDLYQKELVVYLSMAFGNPYHDPWSVQYIEELVGELSDMGVQTIALSDTTGYSTPENIASLFSSLITSYTNMEFGLHLHALPDTWYEKLDAAYRNGCRRFDGVLNGIGGCPLTGHELVGNLNTTHLIQYLKEQGVQLNLNHNALVMAIARSLHTFPSLTTQTNINTNEKSL